MNAYLYISIGMIVGLAISALVGFFFYRRLDSKWSRLLADHDLVNAFATLELMRSDKTALAISNNEVLLDAGVMRLGGFLRQIPPRRWSPDDVFWLRKVKDYRAKFPHASGTTQIDMGVAECLALIDLPHGPVI